MNLLLIPVLILAIYLGLSGFYQLVLAVAARFYVFPSMQRQKTYEKLLVLVPAYAEDAVILNSTCKNLVNIHRSEGIRPDYLVIGDKLQKKTVEAIRLMGADVLEVSFEKSTKVKALQAALAYLGNHAYDAVILLDADNVMLPEFVNRSHQYLEAGFKLIQGERVAANQDSDFALMDGLSEAANTEMLCKGAHVLGFSSKLSGSAMVFDYQLFAESVPQLKAIGGFDKELELYFTQAGHRIIFAPDLQVSDEKVSSGEAFAKQRGRWLQSQYAFLMKSWRPAWSGLWRGNVDFFHKMLQLALPPRALAPFALVVLVGLGMLFSTVLFWISLLGLVALLGSYFISLSAGLNFSQLYRVAMAMPALLGSSLKALGWMKRAKTEFIHTKHTSVKP
jgi:cellulose synthase/poly-beta-1,6-N-acetylglucosamine synthase-like glycosyltransferase